MPETLWVHIQVDLEVADNGASHLRCAMLSKASELRPCSELGFTAHQFGNSVGGFTHVVNQIHILIVRLYWTPEVFSHKDLMHKINRRLHQHIKNLLNYDPRWQPLTAAFPQDDWQFFDYWSLD